MDEMDQQFVRKTYKEKLRPTPAQERALDEVLWRCRELYNAALKQRITAYQRRHVSVSRYAQEAELKEIRAELPEDEAIHSHILQDVLAPHMQNALWTLSAAARMPIARLTETSDV